MIASNHLVRYARRIRELRRAHAVVSEPALAPAFQTLVENLLSIVPGGAGIVLVPEFDCAGVGHPDIALMRAGAPARAFIELKAPDKPADPARWRGHDKRQKERFSELACRSAQCQRAGWARDKLVRERLRPHRGASRRALSVRGQRLSGPAPLAGRPGRSDRRPCSGRGVQRRVPSARRAP